MSRTIRATAIQMDATPTPTTQRLERADGLVSEAASSGAQLVVLPELFNTGYTYSSENYTVAESIDGATVQWMKKLAAHHQIFIAGSLLLKDEGEIYNTALLIAPDGETWRYDKRYPFGWERAYFKEGTGTTIADTELGKLGLMICWDIAHVDLWQAYAGQVDAMVIMSCPPQLGMADFVLPNQRVVPMQALGPGFAITRKAENYFADGMLEEQSAWLGVPTIHASGAGRFSTHLDRLSLTVFWAARPDLWRFLAQADAIFMEADYGKVTKILDAQGHVIAKVDADGDGFTLAEIELADKRPQPSAPQPKARVPAFTRWTVDKISVGVSKKHYEQQRHLFAMRSTL